MSVAFLRHFASLELEAGCLRVLLALSLLSLTPTVLCCITASVTVSLLVELVRREGENNEVGCDALRRAESSSKVSRSASREFCD